MRITALAVVLAASADGETRAKSGPAEEWVRQGSAFMEKERATADASYRVLAEAAYKKALKANPRQAGALIGMARVNSISNRFEASIEWAKKALEVDAANGSAWGLLGDAEAEMGDYDLAFEHYQKMLDLRQDTASLGRSAHLLYVAGDMKKASWLTMKAIAAGGEDPEVASWSRVQLGLLLFAQGGYTPALQAIEAGLTKVPRDPRLLAAMGKVKAALKDYPGAIEAYMKSVAIAPRLEVVAALGDVYLASGDAKEAERQFARVESIAKANRANGIAGVLDLAKFHADHDRDLEEAAKLAEEEYRTRKNVYAADTLAWCYYKTGRIEEAKKTIAAALARGTPEAAFLYHKGMIYAKAGDRVTAQKALYSALSTSPRFDPVQVEWAQRTLAELGSGASK